MVWTFAQCQCYCITMLISEYYYYPSSISKVYIKPQASGIYCLMINVSVKKVQMNLYSKPASKCTRVREIPKVQRKYCRIIRYHKYQKNAWNAWNSQDVWDI